MTIKTYGNANNTNEFVNTHWSIDGTVQGAGGCSTREAVHIGVIDPSTFKAWETYHTTSTDTFNADHRFGNANTDGRCTPHPEKYF
ncbi:MAG: hypothetical protein ABEH43_07990, partial [Flavobacteriales bacterium]